MNDTEERSIPWLPVGIGTALIIGIILAALLLPKGGGPSYQKPETAPAQTAPAPVIETPTPAPATTTGTTSSKKPEELFVDGISPDPVRTGTVVTGRATGSWFFEASFPIELRDAGGRTIATAIASADADWMTTDLVPFHATLRFLPPTSASGTLIFKKDNPSGLPEHDRSIERHVSILAPEDAGARDTVFYLAFISEEDAAQKDCTSIRSAVRVIPGTPAVGKAALEELLKGPTIGEVGDGMLSLIPSGTKLKSLLIKDGVATADFDETLDKGVAGSCKVGAIRAQIEETLKQFPSVRDVVISVGGVTEGILQP